MQDWIRVFDKEISRRRRIAQENKELFKRLHSVNPKGLKSQDKCKAHTWVPATHVMIHDNPSKALVLNDIKRRGFKEASPYKEEQYIKVPQVCWDCDATRIREIDNLTTAQRNALIESSKPKKRRKSKRGPIESVFNELFG